MAAFTFRLELEDGTPAQPSALAVAVPNWRPGDTIHLGRRTLRVVEVRDDDADQPPTLVVEDVSGPATSEHETWLGGLAPPCRSCGQRRPRISAPIAASGHPRRGRRTLAAHADSSPNASDSSPNASGRQPCLTDRSVGQSRVREPVRSVAAAGPWLPFSPARAASTTNRRQSLIGESRVGDAEPSRADDVNPEESVRTG
jgi:hypothetical protein